MSEQALNPLQRAYLLGRSGMFPLGGTSMHDFRQWRGKLDTATLRASVERLAQKHPALRTLVDEARLVQRLLPAPGEHFDCIDLTDLDLAQALQRLEQLHDELSHHVLPLDQAPWFIWLVQLPENPDYQSVVFCSFDGLILDGYSIAQLLKELFSAPLPDAQTPVITRTAQNVFFANDERDRAYWQAKVDTFDARTELPWQQPLETILQPSYRRQGIVIDRAAWQRIAASGARHRLLPNTLLTAVIFEVLSYWAKERHLLVSLPVSNSALLDGLGNHSSFIVVDYRHAATAGFCARARALQKDVLDAMGHLSCAGVDIAKQLVKKFSCPITLPVALTNGLSWGEPLRFEHLAAAEGISRTPQLALDIRLTLSADGDLLIDFDHVEQALSVALARQILQGIHTRLMQLEQAQDLDHLVEYSGDAPVVSAAARHPAPEDYLGQIVQHLLDAPPDKAALVCAGQTLSYAALGQRVATLMAALNDAAIVPGQVLAICLAKGPEHVCVALACALSGIIWVPIDMDSPAERLSYLLGNCRAEAAVTARPLAGIRNLDITALLASPGGEGARRTPAACYTLDERAAYYLYTSGSTGRPKCVILNNLATANVLTQTRQRWQVTADDVLMAVTPFHHDMSVFDVFATFAVGATLVLPALDEIKNAQAWAQRVEQHKVSLWCSVPAIVDMLLACAQEGQLDSLRLIAQGGDYIKPGVIKALRQRLPAARLFSLGGPTETTIWSVWHEIAAHDTEQIPYGQALPGNDYYIVDAQHQHCPVDAVGSICMAGVNLSNGYLVDGELSQDEFILLKDPAGQWRRAFRASDRGYRRADGNIIFAGRDNGYLKVRGVRIASAEVEQALARHPLIEDVAVVLCSNPVHEEHELVAVYRQRSVEPLAVASLKSFLRDLLPESHIPSRWLAVETLPLTANAKVDRNALQRLAQAQLHGPGRSVATATPEAPQGQPVYVLLRQYVSPVLAHTELSADSDLLGLGIRTPQLKQLALQLSQLTNTQIDLLSLAKCRTVEEVVQFTAALTAVGHDNVQV